MTLRHLPAAGHADMPWKNGLGRTAEIARHPQHGDAFDWRLSIATIEADGPFSAFAGCDRTLIPIEGQGLALDFADGTTLQAACFGAMRFAGEAPCMGRLLGGRTRDLNVITRRGIMTHDATVATLPLRLTCAGDTTLIVALGGAMTIATDTGRWRLDADDALRIDVAGVEIRAMAIDPGARVAIATLRRRAG